MLAVIELGGNQFIVRKGDIIDVKKLDKKVSDTLNVEALLISDESGENFKLGNPLVGGSKVELKVIDQYMGDKIRVFKMKAKKRYTRNKGFRPHLTKLEVLNVA